MIFGILIGICIAIAAFLLGYFILWIGYKIYAKHLEIVERNRMIKDTYIKVHQLYDNFNYPVVLSAKEYLKSCSIKTKTISKSHKKKSK